MSTVYDKDEIRRIQGESYRSGSLAGQERAHQRITGVQKPVDRPSQYTRERYEQDRANREAWNANPVTSYKLRIQTYEEWRDEHEWAEDLRTNPFLTFDEWKAQQS